MPCQLLLLFERQNGHAITSSGRAAAKWQLRFSCPVCKLISSFRIGPPTIHPCLPGQRSCNGVQRTVNARSADAAGRTRKQAGDAMSSNPLFEERRVLYLTKPTRNSIISAPKHSALLRSFNSEDTHGLTCNTMYVQFVTAIFPSSGGIEMEVRLGTGAAAVFSSPGGRLPCVAE